MKNKVYALESDDEALSIIKERAEALGLNNVNLVKVENDHFDMWDRSADIALMVTVLHEIDNRQVFVSEVERILKAGGKAAVIEFFNRETPMGFLLGNA